jgi:hypothetical protein
MFQPGATFVAMADVVVERDVAAPADKVWAVLRDFGAVGWIPPAGKVGVEGDGPGMCRRIHGTGDGEPVVERLLSLDDDTRTLRYRIEENNPLPVSSYVGTVTVADRAAGSDGPGGATLRWAAEFAPTGDEDEARTVVELVVGALVGWLDEAVTS